MRFFSVAERELRAGARQKGTHRIRWISAAAAFGLFLWLAWAMDLYQNRSIAPVLFRVFSVFIFLYCLVAGATVTADCISREKREGTLGLLFLTNLNSAEIVAGKLCANGLALIYSLLALFPVMALPVLIGGVTFADFWRTVLALVSVLFFAMAAGFNASAVSVRQFTAVGQATAMALVFGLGLSAASELIRQLGCPLAMADAVATFSPLHLLTSATLGGRFATRTHYWLSLGAVTGTTALWMALAAWRVGRAWRDQPKTVRAWDRFRWGGRLRERSRATRAVLRRRLLAINPFFWLAGRQRISAPVFMLVAIILVSLTAWVTAVYFGKVMFRGMNEAPLLGQFFAWLWTGLIIHGLVLYYGGIVASQRLAEDKQVGALELVLVTPTSERAIGRGLWLAYWRRMLFPVVLAVAVHCFFVWVCMTLMVADPPTRLPRGVTAGELFWGALWNQPVRGHLLEWPIGLIVRILLLFLAGFALNWVTIGWLGRWLGLKMKHPGFAPMIVLVLAVAPPTLLFSLACYLFDKFNFFDLPGRVGAPILMWIGFGIVVGNCVWLSTWAATRLRRDFRVTVTGRYETPVFRDRLRLAWRMSLRFAAGLAALAVFFAVAILLFYGYQNWRGRQRWARFQAELKQRGESMDLAASLPAPVAADANFALSPAFQKLLSRNPTNDSAVSLFAKKVGKVFAATPNGPGVGALRSWMQQSNVAFNLYPGLAKNKTGRNADKGQIVTAAEIWEELQPLHADLQAAALAARLPFCAPTSNRQADAVLASGHRQELYVMEQLQLLFQLRACVLLALERPDAAAADALAGLRLAQLARQSPDWKSSARVQGMLVNSLQPIWEGLARHRWTETQLAAFQTNLSQFPLLADHTNAIGRLVRAYTEVWSAIPAGNTVQQRDALVQRVRRGQAALRWQPRCWWYDNCTQLYYAGHRAIARVDFASGRLTDSFDWDDLEGLPLDNGVNQLFQQGNWWGNDVSQVAFAQTAVNEGIIACALERHRLAHGIYPASLDELVPQYLNAVPRDISRGRPVFYLRHTDGSYELRGAGPNGSVEPGIKSTDDWIWSLLPPPTNSPPVKKLKRK